MRLLFSSPFAAASLLAVACTGTPTIAPEATPATPAPSPQATAAPTPTVAPTPTAEPHLSTRLLTDHPVLVGDDLGDPGYYGATLPATYFTDNGTHHLYVVGFGPGYGVQRAFHATSADGIDWSIEGDDPLASFVSEFSPPGPIPGTVMQNDDGGWVMYFWGVPAPLPDGAQIYRATADDPGGPWTMDDEPVLPIGEPGDVDDLGLDFPAVAPTDDGFVMLYGANGGDKPHTARTLLATSADGVTWEKQGRVMEPEQCGATDLDFIAIPRLFVEEGGYLALANVGDDVYALRSEDATTWTCQAEDPVFPASAIEGNDRVHTYAAARDGDQINLMIEALFTGPAGQVTSNLWLAEVTSR